MYTTTRARFRAAIVVIAPAALLGAFVYHPYIPNLTNKAAVAAAISCSRLSRLSSSICPLSSSICRRYSLTWDAG